jgi:MFS family permease
MIASLKKIYPWIMVLLALLTITINSGMSASITSIFDTFLKDTFQIDNKHLHLLKWRDAISDLSAAIFVFLAGVMIDRLGPKKVILFGTLVLCVAYFLYSQTQNIFQVYGVHILLAIALVTSGSIPNMILISSWFHKHRGLALGIILTGTSLGGFIATRSPLLAYIESNGWRPAMQLLALLPLILSVVILLLMRNRPPQRTSETTNLVTPAADAPLAQGMDFSTAIRTPLFLLLCLCSFCVFYSIVAMIKNTILYVTEAGFPLKMAVNWLSTYFLFSIIGKFVFSFIADYVSAFYMYAICCLLMLIGSLGFSFTSVQQLDYLMPVMAMGWGGIYSIGNLLIMRNFGTKAAGKINGTISIVQSAGLALGPIVTAYLHDAFSYATGFKVVSLLLLLASLLAIRLQRCAIPAAENQS